MTFDARTAEPGYPLSSDMPQFCIRCKTPLGFQSLWRHANGHTDGPYCSPCFDAVSLSPVPRPNPIIAPEPEAKPAVPRRDRYRNNQDYVPQVGDIVRFFPNGILEYSVADVFGGQLRVILGSMLNWACRFDLIRPAEPEPARGEEVSTPTNAKLLEWAKRSDPTAVFDTEEADQEKNIRDNLHTQSDWSLDDYQDFYERDVNFLLSRSVMFQERIASRDETIKRLEKLLSLERATSLAQNLCPDHRDKQKGKPCLACTEETLNRKNARLTADLSAARERVTVLETAAKLIVSRHEWYEGTAGPLREGIDMLIRLMWSGSVEDA